VIYRIILTILVILVFGFVAASRYSDTSSTEAPVSAPTSSEPNFKGLQIN
jgi:hypothetical protein